VVDTSASPDEDETRSDNGAAGDTAVDTAPGDDSPATGDSAAARDTATTSAAPAATARAVIALVAVVVVVAVVAVVAAWAAARSGTADAAAPANADRAATDSACADDPTMATGSDKTTTRAYNDKYPGGSVGHRRKRKSRGGEDQSWAKHGNPPSMTS
jgi:hypothetical protein